MKHLIFALTGLLLVTACNNSDKKPDTDTVVNASGHENHDPGPINDSPGSTILNDVDRNFVLNTGMGNTAEIEAGTLAADKGDNKEVRDFGAMMVKDHGETQATLNWILGSFSLNAPDSVDQEHKNMKSKLSGLKGTSFDREYIAAQVQDHRMTVALFENEITSGSNARLKQFASTTLPHLKMHLDKAEALQAGNK